jgi:hypothetical protein
MGVGLPSARQESHEDSPFFRNVLSVWDWIFSSGSFQNKVSLCDKPWKRPEGGHFKTPTGGTKSYVASDSHIHATNPCMKPALFHNLNFTKVYINLQK